MFEQSLTQWNETSRRLSKIEWEASIAHDHAERALKVVEIVTSVPSWVTRAEFELTQAIEYFEDGLKKLKEAKIIYDKHRDAGSQ